MKELYNLIESQQEGHKDDPVFMIGEQLKEIAVREPSTVEILKADLGFKELFDFVQKTAARLKEMVENIRTNDPETADKLASALKAFGASL